MAVSYDGLSVSTDNGAPQMSRAVFAAFLAMTVIASDSEAALITSARGRVSTKGRARITLNTRGQRQIAITIDPSVTTSFRLDFAYPADLVTPVDFGGFNVSLATTAIEYVAPYGPGPSGPLLIAGVTPSNGIIADITGQVTPSVTPPAPNNSEGGSDLFTLYFIDNNPYVDKVFNILGFDGRGVPPEYARYVSDNYIEGYVDDQFVRFEGDQIEGASIFVAALPDPKQIPLPLSLWTGLTLAGGFAVRRLTANRHRVTKRM